MTRTFIAFATAATLAAGTFAIPSQAEAKCFGCYVGAGVFGGLLLGAAIANSHPYPGYYAVGPGYYPTCRWTKQRFFDGWVWRTRRVEYCG